QLEEMCPKCGKHHLTIRLGRRGRFIGCAGYPDCDYTRNLDGAEGGENAKRVSVPKNIAPDSVTLDTALKLLALPRDLGSHPETGKKVNAAIGRFGPY